MNQGKKYKAIVLIALIIGISISTAFGQQVECSSRAERVTAVTNANGHLITTKFQFDVPNLQPLLTTTFIASGPTCVVAHLSGLARITDNYVVFQVRIDGVPMRGHTFLPGVNTPVVFRTIDANPEYEDEQFIDPTKVVSYNFFASVPPGEHTVQVLAAAGSNIIAGLEPSVNALVLTLEYR
ncbi:MAG TPA: hypothetical protein VFZ23_10350 [Pyrinomonadaceae bacterium]